MKEMKQEGCKDLEVREGQGRERTYRTFSPFESCRSSAVDYIKEISPESPRKMQDEQEPTSEASWNAKRGEEDGWRLEPEGETETPETIVFFWNEVEGVPVDPWVQDLQ